MVDYNFLHDYISKQGKRLGDYQLPGRTDKDIYMVPVSGGADSMALATVLTALFPDIPFTYLFTDTHAEVKEIYEMLDSFEETFGKKVERIGEVGFFELIDKFNGFLPTMRARWCTRELKIIPFEGYLDQFTANLPEDTMVYSFVGIRADESDRGGLESKRPFIKTVMPYFDMGIEREDVFNILNKTLGVPALYKHRTRSGCSTCPFQRKSETLGLLRWNPAEFERGISYEKPSAVDQGRFPDNAVPLTKETSISRNHCLYPIPQEIDPYAPQLVAKSNWVQKRKKKADNNLLLLPGLGDVEKTTVWVGVEFFTFGSWDGRVTPYWQEPVTFSSSKAGLQAQLQRHYEHRKQTAGVYFLDEESMEQELALAIYRIEVPADLLDGAPIDKDSFSWNSQYSYPQLRHIHGWMERSLHYHAIKQRLLEYQAMPNDLWAMEQVETCEKHLQQIKEPVGELLAIGRFAPAAPKVAKEEPVTGQQMAVNF